MKFNLDLYLECETTNDMLETVWSGVTNIGKKEIYMKGSFKTVKTLQQ